MKVRFSLKVIFCFKSPLQIMKNGSYFILKAVFVPNILNFLSWLSPMQKKRLDQKDTVNFTFYDIANWLKNNYNLNIFCNISWSNNNQSIVKNYAENEVGRLVPKLSLPFFFFFLKALYEVKASFLQLNFNIFRWP